MVRKILATIVSLSLAGYVDIKVEPGDTFNTILRRHNVSHLSIDQINAAAKRIPVISKLCPDDQIKLYIDDNSQKLVSAYIDNRNKRYVLNREKYTFKTHPLSESSQIKIITTSHDEKTLDADKLIAQRAAKALFPDAEGMIHVALDGPSVSVIKITTESHTQYAFLQKTNGLSIYVDSHGKTIGPALSRTPTEYKRISSHFNPQRLHPISKKVQPHNGVDLAAPINTPIWAASDGVVIHKSSDTGYGNMLIIQHTDGIQTLYAHLNKFHNNLSVGQKVRAFETIGYVGSTGASTGYHLHFELRINDKPLDPLTADVPGEPQAPFTQPYYF